MSYKSRSFLALSTIPLFTASISAAPRKDPCAVPPPLQSELAKSYPGKTIVRLSDLDDYDKKLFRKDHGNRCPGLTRVDFYGDGKPTLALVLISGQNPHIEVKFVVAHQVDQKWDLRLIETTDDTPVVWREPPGKYEGLYEGQRFIAKHSVVVLCGYGSWAIAYAWIDNKVQKVWLSD